MPSVSINVIPLDKHAADFLAWRFEVNSIFAIITDGIAVNLVFAVSLLSRAVVIDAMFSIFGDNIALQTPARTGICQHSSRTDNHAIIIF